VILADIKVTYFNKNIGLIRVIFVAKMASSYFDALGAA
jgi:hypothetical protein